MARHLIKDRHFGASWIQGTRTYQEDDFGFYRPSDQQAAGIDLLAVLADGMGGEGSGDVASRTVVDSFLEAFANGLDAPPKRLKKALEHANHVMSEAVAVDAQRDGMGCTLVAALIEGYRLYWLSVGDSALFLLRAGRLQRLNADHSYGSYLAQQLAEGSISQEAVDADQTNRNALMSAVTGEPLELVDAPVDPVLWQPGDMILCVSDGLFTLDEGEIASLCERVTTRDAKDIAASLTRAVTAKGKKNQDNTTVLVLNIEPIPKKRMGFVQKLNWKSS